MTDISKEAFDTAIQQVSDLRKLRDTLKMDIQVQKRLTDVRESQLRSCEKELQDSKEENTRLSKWLIGAGLVAVAEAIVIFLLH